MADPRLGRLSNADLQKFKEWAEEMLTSGLGSFTVAALPDALSKLSKAIGEGDRK